MARQRLQPALSLEHITELASIGCSDAEIALLARVSEATLKRRYEPCLKQGRAHLKERLRRKQIERALAGSDTMLIWLGKQYLDQRDKQDVGSDPERPLLFGPAAHHAAIADLEAGSTADTAVGSGDEGDRHGATMGEDLYGG